MNPSGVGTRCLLICAIACLALILLMVAGCGKKDTGPSIEEQTNSFESASPEIKAAWDNAVAAASSNDFATAVLTFRQLQLREDLTPEQRSSVNDRMTILNNEMMAAAEQGDAAALKAIQDVRKGWR